MLRNETLVTTDNFDVDPHKYYFSVCSNGVSCDNEDVMVGQDGREGAKGRCYILARWDSSIQPTYDSSNGGIWTFRYQNGKYIHMRTSNL